MRALSIRQPWAWAIVHAGKDVENRRTGIVGGYRGPVAIHAPVTPDTRALGDPMIRAAMGEGGRRDLTPITRGLWLRGVFVGVADLTDEHTEDTCGCDCSPWAQTGATIGRTMHHIVLTNPRPLTTEIPGTGRLGLWTPPDHVLEALEAA